jgi:hypothetical protein
MKLSVESDICKYNFEDFVTEFIEKLDPEDTQIDRTTHREIIESGYIAVFNGYIPILLEKYSDRFIITLEIPEEGASLKGFNILLKKISDNYPKARVLR